MAIALASVAGLASVAALAATGDDWTTRQSAADNQWNSVDYGNGLFVAVAESGTGNRVMTSPDGVTWTSRASADDQAWRGVAYGNGLFVAVGWANGDATAQSVMTSPDAVTWTGRVPVAGGAGDWESVTYGDGRFVATGANPVAGVSAVMTSTDGVTWTPQGPVPAAGSGVWRDVTHADGRFVAVGGQRGSSNAFPRIMTSPDGLSWTYSPGAPSGVGVGNFYAVTHGSGTFVAVGSGRTNPAGSAAGVIYSSTDGLTWTSRSGPVGTEANSWRGVAYGNGRFVAVAQTGTDRIITSPDGVTWTTRPMPAANDWYSVTYANDVFVSVGRTGSGNRVMTSGDLFPATPAAPEATAGNAEATVTARRGTVGLGTGGQVTTFTITASPGGRSCTATGPDSGSCTISGLTNDTAYTFRATASNGAGTSEASGASAAVTPSPATLKTRTRCVLGGCVTTGTAPAGTTRMVQAARTTRGAKRATGRCTARRPSASGERAYTCTIRLSRGIWNLTTQARGTTGVAARSAARVRIIRTARPAVTG